MKLTEEEKIALLEGQDNWTTLAVPRVGLAPMYMTDGPLGVRKKNTEGGSMLGMNRTMPSTAFPAPAALANSWDERLTETVAQAIGRECRAYSVDVLLAPALNIKRDPRCGRNFEYFSEDPLLSGRMAAAFCRGVEGEGVASCLKHFALNNSENYRYMSNSLADERAIREIYLKGFEIAVKEGKARSVMCSYNRINGVRVSENRWFLTDVLRNEWGFDGVVMTDWGATCDRVQGLKAGVDLDMPGGIHENGQNIKNALRDGRLSMDTVDVSVNRLIRLAESMRESTPAAHIADLLKKHEKIAENAAVESAVLLENDGTLPLKDHESVVVAGELFANMRYQGAGSSDLLPARLVSPKEAFDAAKADYVYGMKEAVKTNSVVLYFGGLTNESESEGYDRRHLRLPKKQMDELKVLAKAGVRPVLVLFGGSPIELPPMEFAAVLFMNLPGQMGGEAVRRLLYGLDTPSGKLSESWVKTTEDIAFGRTFGCMKNECYRENLFVGYRFYEEAPRRLRYPFGHGLSYTQFVYENMTVNSEGDAIRVTLTVKNIGGRDGSEVVQLYAGKNEESRVFKVKKQLCAWKKVFLKTGEVQKIMLTFPKQELAYYHTGLGTWVLENGVYPIYAAASVQDVRLTGQLEITGQQPADDPYSRKVMEAYHHISNEDIPDEIFALTLPCPPEKEETSPPYTLETPVSEYRRSGWGRLVFYLVMLVMSLQYIPIWFVRDRASRQSELRHLRFVLSLIPHNSARSMVQSSGGFVQLNAARALVKLANGHPMQAIRELSACPSGSR